LCGLDTSSAQTVRGNMMRNMNVTHQLQRIRGQGVRLVELKTPAPRRKIELLESCYRALLRRKFIHEQERLEAGERWQDSGFVFTSRNGAPIQPEAVTRQHTAVLKKAKLVL
jgi:integrase